MENYTLIKQSYNRGWKYKNEKSETGVSFSIKGRETERFFLVRDLFYHKTWNIHFLCNNNLTEDENEFLVSEIIKFIQPGEYLATCGYYTKDKISGFNRFYFRTNAFSDTGNVRILKDKNNKSETKTFPILKKL